MSIKCGKEDVREERTEQEKIQRSTNKSKCAQPH
jgi:hypothetical protein